ncbi:hypothetical protein FRACYDRAFT_247139 [Fragilariopsis cylindrus CCMP1102]|uniref:Uncharacterized protein n=1 Tax=Fragilariopsis cylindrus CCMP1102 TaxID=635003 RepID=A0A1E7EXL9_9STRA|nr:hypothetical protein FRACYDRAFT_247139 [Fragilariopsis cylindrus CCMP1102]|eukprot:OEU10597.1 hypothetical protein FRACYDRAFT_247139 [Fragilariopsis cylindrus CCMP1102]
MKERVFMISSTTNIDQEEEQENKNIFGFSVVTPVICSCRYPEEEVLFFPDDGDGDGDDDDDDDDDKEVVEEEGTEDLQQQQQQQQHQGDMAIIDADTIISAGDYLSSPSSDASSSNVKFNSPEPSCADFAAATAGVSPITPLILDISGGAAAPMMIQTPLLLPRKRTKKRKNNNNNMLRYFKEAVQIVPFEYKSDLAKFYIRRPYGIVNNNNTPSLSSSSSSSTVQQQSDIIFNNSNTNEKEYYKRSRASSSQTIEVAVTIIADNTLLLLYDKAEREEEEEEEGYRNNNVVKYYSLDEIIEQSMVVREQYCRTILSTAFDLEQRERKLVQVTTPTPRAINTSSLSSLSSPPPILVESSITSSTTPTTKQHYLYNNRHRNRACLYSDNNDNDSDNNNNVEEEEGVVVGRNSNRECGPMKVMKGLSLRYRIDHFNFFSIIDCAVEDECHDSQEVMVAEASSAYNNNNNTKVPSTYTTQQQLQKSLQEQEQEQEQEQQNNDELATERQEQVDVALVEELRHQVDSLAVRLEAEEDQRHKLEDIIHELESKLLSIRQEHENNNNIDSQNNNATTSFDAVVVPINIIDDNQQQQRIVEDATAHQKIRSNEYQQQQQPIKKKTDANLTDYLDLTIMDEGTSSSKIKIQSIQNVLLNSAMTKKGPILPKVFKQMKKRFSPMLNIVGKQFDKVVAAVPMQSAHFAMLKGDWKEEFSHKASIFVKSMPMFLNSTKLVTRRLGTELNKSTDKVLKHGLEGSEIIFYEVKKSVDDVSLAGIKKLDRANESIHAISDFALSKLESIGKHTFVSANNWKKTRSQHVHIANTGYQKAISKAIVSFRRMFRNHTSRA